MAKDPAFLFYSSDFLTGTILMSDEQVGQYIRLMCLQHQKGHLEEKDMEKICGKDTDIYSKFDKDENGLYYNARLEKEITKRRSFCQSRSKNREGNKKETSHEEHMINICETYDNHMENENVNINKIKNRNKKEIDKRCGEKEEKKEPKEELEKMHFAEFVTMTNDEYEKLVVAHGKELTDQCIQKLDNYKGSNGKKYKSDYRAILNWVLDEVKKQQPQQRKYTNPFQMTEEQKMADRERQKKMLQEAIDRGDFDVKHGRHV